jgi:hypothetical protein
MSNVWPTTVTLNAHLGAGKPASSSVVSNAALSWALKKKISKNFAPMLAPPPPPNLADWASAQVGWGLVLPYRAGLSPEALASADDAPEPIRTLRAARGNAPVFRYRADSPLSITHVVTYRSGVEEFVSLSSAEPGLGSGQLPFYLLIYGSADVVPWEFQFILNATRAVGRLDLEGEALENYVAALMNGWKDASSNVRHALLWSSNNGEADITKLVRDSIAAGVYEDLKKDDDIDKAVFIDGFNGNATTAALIDALVDLRPGFILTTSHGQTGPLDDLQAMGRDLGLLVDQDYEVTQPEKFLSGWNPDGAIWYAHACCSAGSNATTIYDGLVPADSEVDSLLKGVARLGARTAPLPRALLGAKKPLRAFVGQVEPTFDWTLQQPETSSYLTAPVKTALYRNLFQPEPAGMALRPCYQKLGGLYAAYDEALRQFNNNKDTKQILLFCQLAARDVQSMVILGDPTATLPPLKAGQP